MTGQHSAGVLLYRRRDDALQVLLAHMGGPFWQGRDDRAWSIPKGEVTGEEDPFAVACREFHEELGTPVPADAFVDLGDVRQRGGKRVRVWAAEGDLDARRTVSNTFALEWPPGSGQQQEFPEVDRAEWCDLDTARRRLVAGQVTILDRLLAHLDHSDGSTRP